MKTLRLLFSALVALALFAVAVSSNAADLKYPALPDQDLSPGVACPQVTVEMLSVKGCTTPWREHGTLDGMKISDATKKKVYEEYHITSHTPGEYEIDHLISLELGGSNDIKNLWPQPYHGKWNAHMKDRLENTLHGLVVAGKMKLKDAQKQIAANWIVLYVKMFPDDVTPDDVPPQHKTEPDEPDNS